MKILEEKGFERFVFVDNNEEKQGNMIHNYNIISFEEALNKSPRPIFLLAPEGAEKMKEQLTNAGLEEEKDWYSFSVSAYDSYVEEYKRPMKEYLLAMGDCAFTHVAMHDKEVDSLGTMIRNTVGAEKCKVLDMHGMGQQAYYHISKSLIERGEKPTVFLLLLIMETMAAKVPIMPRTQHPKLIEAVIKSCENPNPEFVTYGQLTKERFERFQVEAFASFDEKDKQGQEEILYMELSYLFKYRETTEGVTYLKKTIQMMNEEDIPVVLYVPPVNFYQGEKLFGEEFKEKYETNYRRLYQTLDETGLKYDVADASYLLDRDDFAAINTVDETCKASGRRKLISFLSKNAILSPFFEHCEEMEV